MTPIFITSVKNNGYYNRQVLGQYLLLFGISPTQSGVIINLITKQEWIVDIGPKMCSINVTNFSIQGDVLIGYNYQNIWRHNFKTNQGLDQVSFGTSDKYPCLSPDRILNIYQGHLSIFDFTGQLLYKQETKHERVLYNWVNQKYVFI